MKNLLVASLLAVNALLAHAEVIDIDNAELNRLTAKGVPLVDVRTLPEWEETGIIAGSKLLTFFDEQGQANPPEWLEKLKPIAKPGDPVIVLCRSGNRTRVVSQFLSEKAGYAKVYNVKSGLKGWLKENGPVIPATQSINACRTAKTC